MEYFELHESSSCILNFKRHLISVSFQKPNISKYDRCYYKHTNGWRYGCEFIYIKERLLCIDWSRCYSQPKRKTFHYCTGFLKNHLQFHRWGTDSSKSCDRINPFTHHFVVVFTRHLPACMAFSSGPVIAFNRVRLPSRISSKCIKRCFHL